MQLTVNGASQGSYTFGYDSDQRISAANYPSGFHAVYSYTALGFLTNLWELGSAQPFWAVNSRDAVGHITSEQTTNRANAAIAISTSRSFDANTGLATNITAIGMPSAPTGITWSATQSPCTMNCWGAGNWGPGPVLLANLTYSYDLLGKTTERVNTAPAGTTDYFCYDKLNRLTGYGPDSTCSNQSVTVTMNYDDIGNITFKSDVCNSYSCYLYQTPGKPHAVSSISGGYNGVTNPTFTYDNNGNMQTGAGRTISNNGFDMVGSISQGTTTLCWTCDADKHRVRMDQGQSGSCASPVSSTYYLNDGISGLQSEKTVSGGNTTFKDYLIVGGVIIGTRTQVNASTPTTNYYVLDYHGSIVATTDETGALLCRISYDPWGKSTATGGSCTAPSREYLSQESINTGALINLINLNAHMFDPVLARFMGTDPVTDAFNPQALNLYSYGLNSPLWISDPSGMHGQFWQWLGLAVSIAILVVAPEVEGPLFAESGGIFTAATNFNLAAIGVLTANGAIAGAVGAGISGGNVLQGAEFGALGAGLSAGIGLPLAGRLAEALGNATASAFIAQGFAGGLTSVIEGGNFGSGFLAAGVGSVAGGLSNGQLDPGGLIASAVLGGAASALGGGKFENGAISAAFAYVAVDLASSASAGGSRTAASGALECDCLPPLPSEQVVISASFRNYDFTTAWNSLTAMAIIWANSSQGHQAATALRGAQSYGDFASRNLAKTSLILAVPCVGVEFVPACAAGLLFGVGGAAFGSAASLLGFGAAGIESLQQSSTEPLTIQLLQKPFPDAAEGVDTLVRGTVQPRYDQ